ncbi:rhodanese-like domain-containing protein [Streptomyces sp. INA 01156]
MPGSYNVPLGTLREHREELTRHLDTDVVLVCRSGQRAGQAERALAEAGLPGLTVLSGGMTAWEKSGAPTDYGQERWDMERQVRLAAGSWCWSAPSAASSFPVFRRCPRSSAAGWPSPPSATPVPWG